VRPRQHCRVRELPVRILEKLYYSRGVTVMTRSKLEKLITDFVIQHNLDASFVQQTEGLTYVRFVVEEDFQDD